MKVWEEEGRGAGRRMRESAGGRRQTRGETEPESPPKSCSKQVFKKERVSFTKKKKRLNILCDAETWSMQVCPCGFFKTTFLGGNG